MRAWAARVFGLGLGRLAVMSAALVCLGAAAPSDFANSSVLKIRFGGDQRTTRVVVELDRSTRGRLLADGSAGPLLLALPGVGAGSGADGEGEGLVRAWSLDPAAGAARIELRTTRRVSVVRRFLLSPSDGSPNYRYVVDLAAVGPTPAPVVSNVRLTPVSTIAVGVHTRKVIVIDAGHGGKDPGALGETAHEKDLTLAAARALKTRLERDGRYQVVMTRSRDVFVPLEERVQIARRADADLFISLHADSGGDSAIHGATVYTLSDSGTVRAARNVFNSNGFINVSLPGRDPAVNRILLDLTQRATKNRSSAFAEVLVDRLGGETSFVQHSRRDAGYVVLMGPDVPAVLLEMGFITNHQDETALKNAGHRDRLMDAAGDAIDAYFDQQRRFASR